MKNIIVSMVMIMILSAFSNTEVEKFPELPAERLTGEEIIFPNDLEHNANVLLLVFERNSQSIADTWTKAMMPLEEKGQLNYFEIPMISGFYTFMSNFIDSRMKSGIDEKLHKNVTTYYGPRDEYFKRLNMPDKSQCYIFLVDKSGNIHYRTEGKVNDNNLKEIKAKIKELNEFNK